MALMGPDRRLWATNRALCELLAYPASELATKTLVELTDPADVSRSSLDVEALLIGLRERVALEARLVASDGRTIWAAIDAITLPGDGADDTVVLVQIQDISEQRQREEHLRHLAEHDALTGLCNRRTFEERVVAHLNICRRYGASGALLLLDLDDLKLVNDTLGHAAGDALLRGLAQLLSSRLRESDLVGRLGGDEFGVLLPHANAEGAETVAAGIVEGLRLRAGSWLPLAEYSLTASIGIAVIDDSVDKDADLIARADRAMYEAKRHGRNGWAVWAGAHR